MPRYFVTSSAQFGFGGPVGDQVTTLHARISVDSVLKAIVGLGNGIQGVESPPGTWTYHIADKELFFSSTPIPGAVSIAWYAQDAGSANADTYPTITTPTLDTVADPTALDVSSTTPANNATGVSTRNALVIQFDDDLDYASFEPSMVVLRIPGTPLQVPIVAQIDLTDASILRVEPRSDLAETTLYELLISNDAIYSTGGNQLGADYVLRFTTGADSFDSVHEVTSEGVVERAGPLVIVQSSPVATPPATVVSSNPAANSYTFSGTQLVITMSEALDNAVTPTVTLDIQSIFGLNEYYWGDGRFWSQADPPPFPAVDTVTVNGATITIDLDGELPGNAQVTVTVSGAETDDDNTEIPPFSILFYTTMHPFLVGVPEIRRLVRTYVASDLTDLLIAQSIAQAGLDLYFLVGDKAIPQQRCVIKHQVAIEVMDDWLAQNGGGLSESKTLGAFTVRRGLSTMRPPAWDRLKEQLDKCWYELISYFNSGVATIKGISSPLERKNYRIRTWRETQRNEGPASEENSMGDRIDNLPGPQDEWS